MATPGSTLMAMLASSLNPAGVQVERGLRFFHLLSLSFFKK